MQDSTRCVHHPVVSLEGFSSLAVPTYRASTIVYPDAKSFSARGRRGFDGYTYGLHGTPTTRTLEAQISLLHGGVRTILVPSGQAAASMILMTFLMPGDRVLIPDNVYSPVRYFCADYLKPRGIDYGVYDPLIGAGIADQIDDRTKLVWIESPGSGTMEVQDVPAIIQAAKAKGALTACDNTWASPLLFKPLVHGADFAVEALTKYIGGHSDLLLGSITVRRSSWFCAIWVSACRRTKSHWRCGASRPWACACAMSGRFRKSLRRPFRKALLWKGFSILPCRSAPATSSGNAIFQGRPVSSALCSSLALRQISRPR